MKKFLSLLCMFLAFTSLDLQGGDNTFLDYQNYNHGYCPECNSYPCRCATPKTPSANTCGSCNNGNGCGSCNNGNECGPCNSPAPVCGAECGLSICAIAIAIAAIVATAVIIVTASSDSSNEHSAN